MQAVLLSIHVIICIALVSVILLQRSEGGALGIGGGPGGLMTARGAGNFLTKVTKWLAIIFIGNALLMGWLTANIADDSRLIDEAAEQTEAETESQLPEFTPIPDGDDG